MGKEIIWIDDDIEKIIYIMQGVISKLWGIGKGQSDEQYMSKILLFGNDFYPPGYEYQYSSKDEIKYSMMMEELFYRECLKLENGVGWNNTVYNDNKNLISNCFRILFKSDDEKKEAKLLFEKIKEKWSNNRNEEINSEASDIVKELIKYMNIGENAIIGIDLALLKGDREFILNHDSLIISMELFHQLRETHHCFIYSTYTFDTQVCNKCSEIYKKKYGENFKVIRSCDLRAKNISQKVIDEIIGKELRDTYE